MFSPVSKAKSTMRHRRFSKRCAGKDEAVGEGPSSAPGVPASAGKQEGHACGSSQALIQPH